MKLRRQTKLGTSGAGDDITVPAPTGAESPVQIDAEPPVPTGAESPVPTGAESPVPTGAESIEDAPVAPTSRAWPRRSVLATIAIIAAIVRIPGVLWGLPIELHPDEPVITHAAIDLIRRNSLSPRVFDRPDHLEILLSSFAYRILALVTNTSAPSDFLVHPWRYIAVSRCITVAFSIGAIVLAWCVGRRFGTATAIAAAIFVAFFPPFIANSSYATPDMPLTCLMLAVILGAMRYLERPTLLRLGLMCAAVGVGVTIKYPAAISSVIVGMVIVVVMVRSRDWWRGVRHLLLAPLMFVIAVLAVSHVLVTDLSEVTFQLHNQRGSDHPGAEALGWPGNLAFYAKDYASWAGVVLIAVAAFGVWWCARERTIIALPLLLGVFYWVGLSEVPAHWERWALPMFLSPLLLAAVGVGRIWLWVEESWRTARLTTRSRVAGLSAVLATVAAFQLITGSGVVIAGFAAHDTRIVARPSFRAEHVNKATAIYDGYSPLLPGSPLTIASNLRVTDGQLDTVERSRARFVVTSSLMDDRYTPDRFGSEATVYQTVRSQLPLVYQWTPVPLPHRSALEFLAIPRALRFIYHTARGGDVGPTIQVYSIPAGIPHY